MIKIIEKHPDIIENNLEVPDVDIVVEYDKDNLFEGEAKELVQALETIKSCQVTFTPHEVILFDDANNSGLALGYSSIILHAILPPGDTNTRSAVYCQIDAIQFTSTAGEIISLSEDEEEGGFYFEIHLIPKDSSKVEEIYEQLCLTSEVVDDDEEIGYDEDELEPFESINSSGNDD